MSPQPVEPSPAATLLLLRDRGNGVQVLMVRRRDFGFFGGLMVFPGGGVDAIDRGPLARQVVVSARADSAHRAAALRELAEETGLLLVGRDAVPAPREKDEQLYRALSAAGVTLAGDDLVLVSRWVTPESAPRRFDAVFYVASVDGTPEVRIDTSELTEHHWVAPEEALSRHESGEWPMFLPTVAHLRWLQRHESAEAAVEAARGADGRTSIVPKRMEDGSLVPLLLPAEEP